ncbi:MAG: hypothetical protein JNL06_16185 [Alphaproteobacteria bacterium]|nr:hypothetical protein [Alphaproteobacteria bacterium]
MSKLNIGVGEDFPLDDDAIKSDEREYGCAHWRARYADGGGHRHWRRNGHPMHSAAAIIVLPVAAASVTAAILYPLATLGVIGGASLAAAAYRHGRRHRRWEHRRWREEQERNARADHNEPEPPKENQ